MSQRRASLCGLLVAIGATVMLVEETHSAAIPMWEYLSKDEKMSYLYSMFANQVDDFCEFSDMRDCNRELLKFGLGKLKDMPEDHLDTMDPYQRGAHTLIWDSMMDGHETMEKMKQQQRQRRPSTTPKPNSYEDDQFPSSSWKSLDYQGSASARIETVVYRVPPPNGFVINSGASQYITPKGGYANNNNNGLGNTYQHYQPQYQPQKNNQQNKYNHHENDDDMVAGDGAPLTGPMVVKVHLDGSPVQEQTHFPQDEDLKQYKMSKAKIPTFQ